MKGELFRPRKVIDMLCPFIKEEKQCPKNKEGEECPADFFALEQCPIYELCVCGHDRGSHRGLKWKGRDDSGKCKAFDPADGGRIIEVYH